MPQICLKEPEPDTKSGSITAYIHTIGVILYSCSILEIVSGKNVFSPSM